MSTLQPCGYQHGLHVSDQSPLEAIRRIKLFLKDEAATLLGGRVRIVKYVIALKLVATVLTM